MKIIQFGESLFSDSNNDIQKGGAIGFPIASPFINESVFIKISMVYDGTD